MRWRISERIVASSDVCREDDAVRQSDNVEVHQRPMLGRFVLQRVDNFTFAVDGAGATEFTKILGEQLFKFILRLAHDRKQ